MSAATTGYSYVNPNKIKKRKKPFDPAWLHAPKTDIPGYQEELLCAGCDETLSRDSYSDTQRRRDYKRRCIKCVAEYQGSWADFKLSREYRIHRAAIPQKPPTGLPQPPGQGKKVAPHKRWANYMAMETRAKHEAGNSTSGWDTPDDKDNHQDQRPTVVGSAQWNSAQKTKAHTPTPLPAQQSPGWGDPDIFQLTKGMDAISVTSSSRDKSISSGNASKQTAAAPSKPDQAMAQAQAPTSAPPLASKDRRNQQARLGHLGSDAITVASISTSQSSIAPIMSDQKKRQQPPAAAAAESTAQSGSATLLKNDSSPTAPAHDDERVPATRVIQGTRSLIRLDRLTDVKKRQTILATAMALGLGLIMRSGSQGFLLAEGPTDSMADFLKSFKNEKTVVVVRAQQTFTFFNDTDNNSTQNTFAAAAAAADGKTGRKLVERRTSNNRGGEVTTPLLEDVNTAHEFMRRLKDLGLFELWQDHLAHRI
ncbi:hypothetical protein DFJ77DRAFT_551438 [Powellomyces hirtus]|nr:hypothetical protein DFJ77DRAFT_444173 [Powellomyces hirtus]KAI8907030.1 hypothetical protein DFJ77DRAFT_551438 [Powellomyces hirtus]